MPTTMLSATPLQPRKVAVIVGASRGIGAALAKQLQQEGYLLALVSRSETRLKALAEELNAGADALQARYYVHDVTQYEEAPALLQRIISDMGRLDLFVYNAGISLPTGFKKYDFEKDRRTIEVNLLGALAWLNPVAAMFQNLGYGHIVGISSVAGERGRVGNPSYNASKAALTCYLEALRNRLTRFGVHVLTVKPGFVDTDMLKDAKKTFWVIPPEQAARDIVRAIARRRQEIYTPVRWRWVMFIIRNIPSFIFRRMAI